MQVLRLCTSTDGLLQQLQLQMNKGRKQKLGSSGIRNPQDFCVVDLIDVKVTETFPAVAVAVAVVAFSLQTSRNSPHTGHSWLCKHLLGSHVQSELCGCRCDSACDAARVRLWFIVRVVNVGVFSLFTEAHQMCVRKRARGVSHRRRAQPHAWR